MFSADDTVTAATHVYGNYIDELVESEQWSGPNPPTRYYPLTDDQFSVAAFWEARSDGTRSLAQRLSYGDYGSQIVRNPNGTIAAVGTVAALRHGYTGRLHDATTGLTEYRHRWMNPTAGTFLQRDPLGYVDGENLYVYVRNRPTIATDPNGLQLRLDSMEDEKFFHIIINRLCPNGFFKIIGGRNNRRIEAGISDFCNDGTRYVGGGGCSGPIKVSVPARVKSSKRPTICQCLCDAINSKRKFTLHHSYPPSGFQHSPGGYVLNDNYNVIYVGLGRPEGYGGRYLGQGDRPADVPVGRVRADSEIIFAHELCGHALPMMPHPSDPTGYTEFDPVIIIENQIRKELGPDYGFRS